MATGSGVTDPPLGSLSNSAKPHPPGGTYGETHQKGVTDGRAKTDCPDQ